MLNVKRSTVGALSTVALVLCLTLGLAACAPQTSEPGADADGSSAKTTQTAAGDGTGAYVSDEQCLSCHGGSYEALADSVLTFSSESIPARSSFTFLVWLPLNIDWSVRSKSKPGTFITMLYTSKIFCRSSLLSNHL